MLAVSYFHAMSYRADDPQWKGRDRFLLSVGLYAIALYAALIEAGILPEDEIPTYGSDDSRLPMSGMAAYTPGMEITGGSLGQGLSAVDVEEVFREHADELNFSASPGARVIAFDGTALKGSFDNFRDAKAQAGAQRVRRRHGACAGAHRNQRKVRRNPRRAKVAGGTQRGRPYRHLRRDALPKKPSRPPPPPARI